MPNIVFGGGAAIVSASVDGADGADTGVGADIILYLLGSKKYV